ncbi:uncharacterized protein LOC113528265 isoform X1 [Pangasianodon hypophthalmus]|uniref:uncharacterized protein LOC113528265 isoform X1 n=1 Tax=Pangasianodon hypophthalmus TaxID=310915 RepID=UPI002307C6D0|nr:uncharacterized protein LOC113528265 isoform X1 [Pangasianodon hypophthalmus]
MFPEQRVTEWRMLVRRAARGTDSVLWSEVVVVSCAGTPSPAPPFGMAKLNESAALTCHGKCPGTARWIMSDKRRTVAQCNQTTCLAEEGFNITHAQYLTGDLSLTITAADYSKRTWYTCQCDGKEICRLYLRIERINCSRQIEHGDSFTVEFFISERVKVTFNRTDDDGRQKSVTLYESSEKKVHYHPDYEKRALSKSCFILNDVRESDSGVYTVWDADNDEIIATHTLSVTAKKTDEKVLPPVKGEHVYSSWVVGLGFCLGLVIGIVLHRFVFPFVLKGWDWVKRKTTNAHSTAEENDASAEKAPLSTSSV